MGWQFLEIYQNPKCSFFRWFWRFSAFIQESFLNGSHFGHLTILGGATGSSIDAEGLQSCGLPCPWWKSLHFPLRSWYSWSQTSSCESRLHLLHFKFLPLDDSYFFRLLIISVNFFKPPVCSNNVPITRPSAPAFTKLFAVLASLIPPPTMMNPSKTCLTVLTISGVILCLAP